MRLVCFNCNGIRSRMHQLAEIVEKHSPALIGLQETKVQDDEFPLDEVRTLGYEAHFHGQKGHYGVALLTRSPPSRILRGLPGDGEDAQRRLIGMETVLPDGRPLIVLNGYFPQGENCSHPVKFPAKAAFYAAVKSLLSEQFDPDSPLILMGDFNVAPQDIDIGIGEENRRRWLREGHTSFLPEERGWYASLLDWGLIDTWRVRHPDDTKYFSWFDYRSKGFEREPKRGLRIDMILASRSLAGEIHAAGIDYGIRAMARPSDHCPVWTDIG